MSSYNLITKIKYTGNASDLVSLNEYIVFQDDKAKRKYIVFKFTNNVTQQLLGMEFEVCQYNIDGNLTEKSVVVYNKFLAGAEEEFVPKAKLRVSYHCSTISVRLIKAVFDRFVWNEGEYEENCYRFDQFYSDEKPAAVAGANAGGADGGHSRSVKPAKEKKPKKSGKKQVPFAMCDATKKNFAVFPKVFNVLIFILVLAFVISSVLILKLNGKKFTLNDYQLRIIDGKNVAVCGYLGDDGHIDIEEKLGDYTVIKIDNGAFKKSKITSVTIKCDIIIENGAFVGCGGLSTVTSESYVDVMEGAFQNCPNVKLNISNGYIDENAIING